MRQRTSRVVGSILVLILCRLATAYQEQDTSIFSEGSKRTVVIENDIPTWKFISRTGSMASVQLRKQGNESAFAVNVIDWDNFSMKTGWLFVSKDRVAFESDESSNRSFDAAKTDIKKLKGHKSYNGQNWFVVKVKGKEKRFMIVFNPTPASRTGVWGAHQKPVFELLEQLFANYDAVEKEFQSQLAKVSAKPPAKLTEKAETVPRSETDSPSIVSVEITSEPSGAEIYIDGVFTGSTPSKLPLVPGEHRIRVTRPGFVDWERSVQVELGSAKSINAILEKKS